MHAGEASLDAAPGEDVYELAWKEPFQKVAPFSTATQHEVLPTTWRTHPPQRHRLPEAWHRQSPVGLVASEGTVRGFISATGVSSVG